MTPSAPTMPTELKLSLCSCTRLASASSAAGESKASATCWAL